LLLLIRKRKYYFSNKLKSNSKFLSNKRNRQELIENETSPEREENKNEIKFFNINNKNECKNFEEKKKDIEKYICQYDQFKENELDPYTTNAEKSCLWELYSLKNHYNFKIRSLVHKFERNFLKNKEFDISSISNLKDDDLLYEINEKSIFYLNASSKKEDINKIINKKFEDLL